MPLVRPLSTGVALALWLLFTDSFIPSAISPRSATEKTSVFQEDDQWATTSLFENPDAEIFRQPRPHRILPLPTADDWPRAIRDGKPSGLFRPWVSAEEVYPIPRPSERERRDADEKPEGNFTTTPLRQPTPFKLLAYDCSRPTGLTPTVPPGSDVCQKQAHLTKQQEQEFRLLQASPKKRLLGYHREP